MKRLSIYNEHSRQALRTTLTIVAPVTLLFYTAQIDTAIAVGLGALLIALSDLPGNLHHKTWSLPCNSLVLAIVALCAGVLIPFQLAFVTFLVLCCFGFSLLFVYGGAISALGNLALIMLVFTLGLHPENAPRFSLEVFVGGLWYTLSAWLYARAFPYRHIEQELQECITEIASFLNTKASFYNPIVPLETCYRRVVPAHLRVSEKQEKLRAILLQESVIMQGDHVETRRLIHRATELIDLYEEVLSIHQDYGVIRQTLQQYGILSTVHQLIRLIVVELQQPAPRVTAQIDMLFNRLKQANETINEDEQLVARLLSNFKNIRLKALSVQSPAAAPKMAAIPRQDALRFAENQQFSLKPFLQQLNYRSPVFRFALRLTLCCLAGYIAMQLWLPGKYNYWLLLTIVIVARPGFSTTRRRNFQRLTGSLTGVVLAFLLIQVVRVPAFQLLFVIACLFGYLAFLYINYQVSVVFITIVAILGLGLLGGQNDELLWQRAFDSLLGCAAAVGAGFLFPFWESKKLKDQLIDQLEANVNYLKHLRSFALHGRPDHIAYKLARKRSFTSAAAFSRTYQHALAEPGRNNFDQSLLYQFQVSNHQLYGAAASLFLNKAVSTEQVDKAIHYLNRSLEILQGSTLTIEPAVTGQNLLTRMAHDIFLQSKSFVLADSLPKTYK